MKIKIQFLALMMLLSAAPFITNAKDATETTQQMEVRAAQIQDRVNEIKAMDFSQLTREQRKSLRTELRSEKKELSQMSPVIYISAGALILIIILLIILL